MSRTHTQERFLLLNGFIGICFLVVFGILFRSTSETTPPEYRMATVQMQESLQVIQDYCTRQNINMDNPEDIGHTGLIGPEWTDLTTTIGDPEAKRTTLNPNFAALIVHLLREAGVKKGDTIAIGSSASFPALLIASLSAAKAMDLHPLVIFSFGSSSYGASNPDFTLWDMYSLLLDNRVFDFIPVAASIGGEDDTGSEMDSTLTNRLRNSLTRAGIPLILEKDLQKNRLIRKEYYFGAHPNRIKAFINSGGGYANIGSSPAVLNIKPGLVRRAQIPDPSKQGMIHDLLQMKIPVIHLLFIKGLAQKYNLPWDPATQPGISDQALHFNGNRNPWILVLSLIGLGWFIAVLIRFRVLYNSHK